MAPPTEHGRLPAKRPAPRGLFLGTLAALLLIAVFAWYVGRQVARFWGETTLATQTSPDQTWSVTIRGKRTIWGSIEVACQTRDSSGRAGPWSVVDSVGSWEELHYKYAKIDFEGDVAIAAGERFVLPHLQERGRALP